MTIPAMVVRSAIPEATDHLVGAFLERLLTPEQEKQAHKRCAERGEGVQQPKVIDLVSQARLVPLRTDLLLVVSVQPHDGDPERGRNNTPEDGPSLREQFHQEDHGDSDRESPNERTLSFQHASLLRHSVCCHTTLPPIFSTQSVHQ